MSDLNITATQSSPSVITIREAGSIIMRGDSYPENSVEFFVPIVQWVEEYLKESKQALNLELHLLYLNTSSVKAMMDIFDLLEEAHQNGREVSVQWFYDEENKRVADLAEEFKEDCSFSFEITGLEA